MAQESLSAALEREHREIDGGIEAFAAGLATGETDPAPLLRAMAGLRRHIYLEEEFIFPPLKSGGLMMAIFVMLREHGQLWDAMAELDDLLANSSDARELTTACEELLAALESHNEKEEPVIYPQADEQLSEEATSRLQTFLATGTMPANWRCEKATR